jgi:hypothetical protein
MLEAALYRHSNNLAVNFPKCIANEILLGLRSSDPFSYSEVDGGAAATALPGHTGILEL